MNCTLPTVSFVVPLFNQLHVTKVLLQSLLSTLPAGLVHEVLLTDDASTDGTQQWLASLQHPSVKVLTSHANTGFAANVNRAAMLATGDVLVLLNNDLVLQQGWLEPLLAALQTPEARVGVVGNLQRRVDDGTLDHAGVCLNLAGQLEHIRTPFAAGADSPPTRPALAVTGACMLLRRTDFVACGGFDERFHNGGEDMDLCFKLRQRGLRAVVATGSCVGHHVSASRGPASLNDERNSRLLFHKWRSLLKQELADQWQPLLAIGGPYPEPPETLVDAALMRSPHLAARRVAEALLVRQEERWAELLGPMPDNEMDSSGLSGVRNHLV